MAETEKPGLKAKSKKKPKFTDKAQSERFIEAARELGIDNEKSAAEFEQTFMKIVPPRSHSKS
jgi:hypothetical protein